MSIANQGHIVSRRTSGYDKMLAVMAYCSECGNVVEPDASFCIGCGKPVGHSSPISAVPSFPHAPPSVAHGTGANAGSSSVGLGIVGLIVGAFIGFLLRPSAMLVGQLPFETVVARGGNLRGLDQLLVPTAEASFNIMVVGAILGAVAGAIIGRLTTAKRS